MMAELIICASPTLTTSAFICREKKACRLEKDWKMGLADANNHTRLSKCEIPVYF